MPNLAVAPAVYGNRSITLRHGWATAALRADVHPKLVQEVIRHSNYYYSTTADTYTHVMPAHSAKAVQCARPPPIEWSHDAG